MEFHGFERVGEFEMPELSRTLTLLLKRVLCRGKLYEFSLGETFLFLYIP